MKQILFALIIAFAACGITFSQTGGSSKSQKQQPPQPGPASMAGVNGAAQTQVLLVKEVRHEILMLPYYGVFDWIDFQISTDGGAVTLNGQVVRPTAKSDAEAYVKKIQGIAEVDNQIEVLPLSPMDDQLRRSLYKAIYNFDSPLYRYAVQAVPPIHIIVSKGRATLKGVVATKSDSTLAYIAARGVAGVFEVTNDLQIETVPVR